jgi:hypothetical protein
MKKIFMILAVLLVGTFVYAQEAQCSHRTGLTHFVPMDTCRVTDTRYYNAFPLWPGFTYRVSLPPCSIPREAVAVVGTLTVTDTQGAGFLGVWSGTGAYPGTSALSYERAGQTISNAFTVKTRNEYEGSGFSVAIGVSGTHLIVDIVGYYVAE